MLFGSTSGGEPALTADIEPGDIALARLDFDAVGHYARLDVFWLAVNEAPQRPVDFGAPTPPVARAGEHAGALRRALKSGTKLANP